MSWSSLYHHKQLKPVASVPQITRTDHTEKRQVALDSIKKLSEITPTTMLKGLHNTLKSSIPALPPSLTAQIEQHKSSTNTDIESQIQGAKEILEAVSQHDDALAFSDKGILQGQMQNIQAAHETLTTLVEKIAEHTHTHTASHTLSELGKQQDVAVPQQRSTAPVFRP